MHRERSGGVRTSRLGPLPEGGVCGVTNERGHLPLSAVPDLPSVGTVGSGPYVMPSTLINLKLKEFKARRTFKEDSGYHKFRHRLSFMVRSVRCPGGPPGKGWSERAKERRRETQRGAPESSHRGIS